MLHINIKKEKAPKITCLIRYGNIFFAFSFSLNHLKVGLLSRKNQREEGKGKKLNSSGHTYGYLFNMHEEINK